MISSLGYIAQIAFGLRFFVQWLHSEREMRSVTPKSFWHLSIIGNLLLYIYSMNELLPAVSLMQSQNLILSMRNLNLQAPKEKQAPFALVIIALALFATFTLFCNPFTWDVHFTSPVHLFGLIGLCCFAARFWVQWWQQENQKEGQLTETFWWISLVGAIVCMIYFLILEDFANFIGPLLSILPYSRNLYFIRKAA